MNTFVWYWTNRDGSKGEVRGKGEHAQDAFTRLTKEQREQVTHADGYRKVLTYETDFQEYHAAIDKGERVEIDEEMFYYWLEILPPVYMRRRVRLPGGLEIAATFGFAEGPEKITAFWSERGNKPGEVHYFAQRTEEKNRGS